MIKQIDLKRNYFLKLLYQILSLIVPLITTPYVSRVIGNAGIGIYSYTSSIMTYFTIFASLGTINYGMREIAQCRDDIHQMSNVFWSIEIMSVCTTLANLIVWFLLICVASEYKTIFITLTPTLIAVAADISWLYTGLERIQYTVAINLICKLIGVAAVFIFINGREDLPLYVFIMSAVTCIGNISMWCFLPRFVTRLEIRNIRLGKHFRETLKYFITTVAISIYTVLDKTMIGILTHDTMQSGYYEQTCRIINYAKPLAFSTINDIMAPRMSYLFAKKRYEEIRARIDCSLSIELFLSVGCCFGLISVADIFVPIYYGDGYEPVIPLLKLMSPILIFICISTCLGLHYYVPSGNILLGTNLTVVGSIINVIINIPMIKLLNAKGAIIASLLAEGLIAVLYAINCKGKVRYTGIMLQLYKKIFAGVIMYVVCTLIRDVIECTPIFFLFTQVAAGTIVYITVLALLKDSSITIICNIMKKVMKVSYEDDNKVR